MTCPVVPLPRWLLSHLSKESRNHEAGRILERHSTRSQPVGVGNDRGQDPVLGKRNFFVRNHSGNPSSHARNKHRPSRLVESHLRDEWERIEAELETVREELLGAIRDDEPNPEAVWPKVDEMAQLRARLERQAVEQLMQEKRVLTPEQQDQYFTHVESRMRQGRGYGYGRGRGGWTTVLRRKRFAETGKEKGEGKGGAASPDW